MEKSYFIKERLIAIGAKFDVFDDRNNEVYLVEADKFDFGKNINVYTPDKSRKLLYMRQKIRFGAHKYIMYDEAGNEFAVVQKEFMNPKYNISGSCGNVVMEDENIWGRRYHISKDGCEIGYISKELNIIGRDKYNLKVFDENYTIFLVGLLVMVDMVRFHDKNK